jgi:dihydrofolate reductase
MKLIVAVNNHGFIGNNGKMMWKCRADMKHFKTTTIGNIVIVGAKTFWQDFSGKPLPQRYNIVVGQPLEGVECPRNTLFVSSLGQAVERASSYKYMGQRFDASPKEMDIWVIGGQSIYEQLLPLCDEVHMSIIDNDQIGDRKFVIPDNYRGRVITCNFSSDIDYVVKDDMICPVAKTHCDDECCTVSSVCNLKPGTGGVAA